MSQYIVDSSRTAANSQPWLIGAPLAITMVFCFCFVAFGPHKNTNNVSASTTNNTSDTDDSVPLPPIGISNASIQTLSPLPQTNTDLAAEESTATPQTNPNTMSGLQSAGQNGQQPKAKAGSGSSSAPITVPKTPTKSTLSR